MERQIFHNGTACFDLPDVLLSFKSRCYRKTSAVAMFSSYFIQYVPVVSLECAAAECAARVTRVPSSVV